MSGPKRKEFAPSLRVGIANQIPAGNTEVQEMIDRWRDGEDPDHPLEAGVFAVCDELAQELAAAAERAGEGGDS